MADPQYLFQPILYRAITPIHVGSGQDVGVVDLPVIRERTTDHPYLPGSGIRGALRARCQQRNEKLTTKIFGSDDSDNITSGCLSVLDAHLLLFPVRSSPGLFHWITCPFLLRRQRDLHQHLKNQQLQIPAPPEEGPAEGQYMGGSHATLYLEEYPFDSAGDGWSWDAEIPEVDADRVLLLHDADFLHFVRTSTLVRQRNRLTTTKTVLEGGLFSVEALPPESWLLGFVGTTTERVPPAEEASSANRPADNPDEESQAGAAEGPLNPQSVWEALTDMVHDPDEEAAAYLHLGGEESVGMGITRLDWGWS